LDASRRQILEWARQGDLPERSLDEALRLAEAEPTLAQWTRFLDRLALWAGAIFLAVGVIFFFAFNWQELGRYAKFGLVELCLAGAVAAAWGLGLERLSGKAALCAATLLVGALLALVGQTYQTGADPWQLFAVWALMVIPWVVIGRFGALLFFWVALVNLALLLYFQTFPRFFGLLGLLFSTETLLWTFFILNTLILCLWEFAAQRQVVWLQERWPLRILAVASGALITCLAVWAIFEFRAYSYYNLLGYLLWLGAAYLVYRRMLLDIFVLAGAVLSVVIVVAAALGYALIDHGGAEGGLFVVGVAVIGLSALGGYWLKSLVQEARS
jgi:uncharacterized membrane protein